MGKTIIIDPITRLEGHGKISIFLNDEGNVDKAFFQIPELRGFEEFCIGRPAEDMPQITSRICGVCPTAHHIAATKTLDSLWGVKATPTANVIRELFYNMFMMEDHTIHFYFLGGPDFIVGPNAPAPSRNILGVIDKVGVDVAKRVINTRKKIRDLMAKMGGKAIHPVLGLPGGVSKAISEELKLEIQEVAKESVEFAKFTLDLFNDLVLKNKDYLNVIKSDIYFHETNYMGMVDNNGKVNFYDGRLAVIDPTGNQIERFDVSEYADIFSEHVEEWSYIKFPFLKKIGWKGFVDGIDSGVTRVGPLARLNVSTGMATPLAHAEYEKMYETLGGSPVHNTLALHWARLIELLYAAERCVELSNSNLLTSSDIRNMNLQTPSVGFGVVEAPRGTLIHHYNSNNKGIITQSNLMVATVFNSAPMCMSIEKAASKLIQNGKVNDGLLNMVEMAFRAYDPCLSCATHNLPGKMPIELSLHNNNGKLIRKIIQDSNGNKKNI